MRDEIAHSGCYMLRSEPNGSSLREKGEPAFSRIQSHLVEWGRTI